VTPAIAVTMVVVATAGAAGMVVAATAGALTMMVVATAGAAGMVVVATAGAVTMMVVATVGAAGMVAVDDGWRQRRGGELWIGGGRGNGGRWWATRHNSGNIKIKRGRHVALTRCHGGGPYVAPPPPLPSTVRSRAALPSSTYECQHFR
jgi:hypothetical protein